MPEYTGDEIYLPYVSDSDISAALYEDITDPTHRNRLDYFTNLNPDLVHEISRRAYITAHTILREEDRELISTLRLQKAIVDTVTFALDALEKSLKRKYTSATDDVFYEDPPHSSEPDDDQSTE